MTRSGPNNAFCVVWVRVISTFFFTFFFFFFLLTDVFGSICVLTAQREFACVAAAMIMSPNDAKSGILRHLGPSYVFLNIFRVFLILTESN